MYNLLLNILSHSRENQIIRMNGLFYTCCYNLYFKLLQVTNMKLFHNKITYYKIKYLWSFFVVLLCFPQLVEAYTSQTKTSSEPSYSFTTGNDFFTYEKPFPSDKGSSGHEINMELFFAYDCATCLTALDSLHVYQKQHKNIHIKLQPVAVEKQTFSADIYYSLLALGREDLAEKLIFDSTGYENKKLTLVDEKNFGRWLTKNDISSTKFIAALNLNTVQQKVNDSIQRTAKYGVYTVQFLVIDGQYVLTKQTLFNDDYTYAVLNFLIDKIEAQRKAEKVTE